MTDQEVGAVNFKSHPKHNIIAFLDETSKNGRKYATMINFLKRSRIFEPISKDCEICMSMLQEFWNNAEHDTSMTPSVIKSEVRGHSIVVSAKVLREVVGFVDSAQDPVELHLAAVRGCIARMKYDGDLKTGTLRKLNLCPEWKCLAYVLLHCLGSQRTSNDQIRKLQFMMAALIQNRPFNFSQTIFNYMVDNLTIKKGSGDKFLQYPRFIQLIINVQAPGLEKLNDDDVLKLEHMTHETLNQLRTYRERSTQLPTKRLFGHITDPEYRAPPKRKWRNADGDSDVVELVYQPTGSEEEDDDAQSTAAPKTFEEEKDDSFINLEGGEGTSAASNAHFTRELREEVRQSDILEGREPPAKRQKKKARKYQGIFIEKPKQVPNPAPVQSVRAPKQPQQQQQQQPAPQQQPQQPPQVQQAQFVLPPNVAQELSDLNRVMLKLMMFKSEQEEINHHRDARIAQLEAENRQLNLTVVEQGSSIKALQESNSQLIESNTKLLESNKNLEAKIKGKAATSGRSIKR